MSDAIRISADSATLPIAIGNAGIWDYSISLVDLPADRLRESFDELFQINVLGYLMLAKAALKPLVESRGSLIFTVSNAGFLPGGGGTLYTGTKHAVVGLIRQLAFELAPHVRVNGVAPGAIATQLKGPESLGMAQRRFPGDRMSQNAADFVPLGTMPTPEEYAGAYVFHTPAVIEFVNGKECQIRFNLSYVGIIRESLNCRLGNRSGDAPNKMVAVLDSATMTAHQSLLAWPWSLTKTN